MKCYIFLILTCMATLLRSQNIKQDYDCTVDGVRGQCLDLRVCPSALKDLKLKIKPKICSFNGTSNVPNVCCVSPIHEKASLISLESVNCPPIPASFLSPEVRDRQIKRGHKAWAKCLEYQENIFFPCTPRYGRSDRCYMHKRVSLVGGIDAENGEFPHMALLGYGNDTSSAQWYCGGSVISERYILTAGHCISTTELVPVTFAALGVLSREEPHENWDFYKIKEIIKHPDYKPPSKYNDIALLKTDKEIQYKRKVIPACLHIGDEVPDSRVSATGWGALGDKQRLADVLQDVPLWKVPDANCSFWFPAHRLLETGYNSITQVCYGDDGRVRDTCRGDSGGPLSVVSQDINCMHLIIGITSFGYSNCGQVGYPGIYTRVAHYVPWIESIVWP